MSNFQIHQMILLLMKRLHLILVENTLLCAHHRKPHISVISDSGTPPTSIVTTTNPLNSVDNQLKAGGISEQHLASTIPTPNSPEDSMSTLPENSFLTLLSIPQLSMNYLVLYSDIVIYNPWKSYDSEVIK